VSSTATDICRVTVVTPHRSVEFALPTYLPLVDMVVPLVGMVDEQLLTATAGKGVVLQRLGEEPLDQARTVAALGLRDGDVLHLREADNVLPSLRFDDLADGIGVRLGMLPDRWASGMSRPVCLALAVLAMVLGTVLLYARTPPVAGASVAGGAALVVFAAALAAVRGWADRSVALVLCAGALALAATSGVLGAQLLRTGGSRAGLHLDMMSALLGGGADVVVGVAAALLLAGTGEFFAPALALVVVTAAALAAVVGALVCYTSLTVAAATALVAVAVLLFSPTVPTISARLAGLRLPDLPQSAADVERPVEPIAEAELGRQTEVADRYVTGMHAVLAGLELAAVATLSATGDVTSLALAGVLSVLLLLRSRTLSGCWQRWLLIGAGALGLTATVAGAAAFLSPSVRAGLAAVIAVGAGLGLVAASRMLPDRRIRPYWGRLAEISETLLAAALLPLVLTSIGLLGYVRHIAG
jgi:type VII secretion integral membrane protein EccD